MDAKIRPYPDPDPGSDVPVVIENLICDDLIFFYFVVVVVVLHGHICGLSENILLAYCPPLYYLSSCLPALRGQFILGISCTLP